MAGKKLSNCFVKFKNDCGFYNYFRVIKQEDNLCTLLSFYTQQKPIKIVKKVDELEKIKVLTICLKSEEIEKINSDLNENSVCTLSHKHNKMFEKAFKEYNGDCVLHVINHKYPHLFYNFSFVIKYLDKNKKLYYIIDIYKLLYQCNKNKYE